MIGEIRVLYDTPASRLQLCSVWNCLHVTADAITIGRPPVSMCLVSVRSGEVSTAVDVSQPSKCYCVAGTYWVVLPHERTVKSTDVFCRMWQKRLFCFFVDFPKCCSVKRKIQARRRTVVENVGKLNPLDAFATYPFPLRECFMRHVHEGRKVIR